MRPLLLLTVLGLLTVPARADDAADEATALRSAFAQCGGVPADTLPLNLKPGLYRGTLGTQRVSLQLSASTPQQVQDHPETLFPDRYSYDRFGLDIVLDRGRAADRTANYAFVGLEQVDTYGDRKVRGCLSLSADGRGLSGAWRTPDGKMRLPVALKPVNVAAEKLALPASPGLLKLRRTDPFTFLHVNHPWVTVRGGVQEPVTQVTYPRVPGAAALNLSLQDHQLELVGEALGCRGGNVYVGNKADTDFTGVGQLTWTRAGLVSLTETADYFCGGAHPDNFLRGLTLDARTGKAVTLTGRPGAMWPGLTDTRLLALYRANYPEAAAADCRTEFDGQDTDPGYSLFETYLTPAGLAVWPSFLPHVVTACAEVVTLPYAAVRAQANPKGPYFRAVYGR